MILYKAKSRTRAEEALTTGAKLTVSFCGMKQLRVLLLPPGWDASPSQGHPQHYDASTHLYMYTWWGKVSFRRKQHDGRDWATNHRPQI